MKTRSLLALCCNADRFVMTGSDDTNLRIWKANASEKLGTMVPREERKLEYRQSLKRRYVAIILFCIVVVVSEHLFSILYSTKI